MKLEIGKEYKTRSGLKVKIYDIAGAGEYPVVAGVIKDNIVTPTSYTIDGVYVCGRSSSYDIVGEWQEPLDFDWSCLPAWVNNYISMEKSGNWYAYRKEPQKNKYYWETYEDWCIDIPSEYAPKNFTGTWENSLYKNPNIKQSCEK